MDRPAVCFAVLEYLPAEWTADQTLVSCQMCVRIYLYILYLFIDRILTCSLTFIVLFVFSNAGQECYSTRVPSSSRREGGWAWPADGSSTR